MTFTYSMLEPSFILGLTPFATTDTVLTYTCKPRRIHQGYLGFSILPKGTSTAAGAGEWTSDLLNRRQSKQLWRESFLRAMGQKAVRSERDPYRSWKSNLLKKSTFIHSKSLIYVTRKGFCFVDVEVNSVSFWQV